MKTGKKRKLGKKPTTLGISVIGVAARALSRPRTIKACLSYLSTVMGDFFFLQFAVKFGWKKIQIINVDHPLDDTVPFTPERVGVYLDFIAFWLRPLGYIGRRFGADAQRKHTAEFLSIVTRCYKDAAEVYRFRMTTTRRPKYHKGKFLTIHLFDPHYMCVPSLHIIIVTLAYTFYRKAFEELGMGAEEADALNAELYGGALRIAETVLYIKQHSVNCIPAALYVMTRVSPEEMTPSEAMRFVGDLFKDATDVTPENANAIRLHISEMYERLFLEGCHDSDWITPLQRWLNEYSSEEAFR
jgi:hypothetical protein